MRRRMPRRVKRRKNPYPTDPLALYERFGRAGLDVYVWHLGAWWPGLIKRGFWSGAGKAETMRVVSLDHSAAWELTRNDVAMGKIITEDELLLRHPESAKAGIGKPWTPTGNPASHGRGRRRGRKSNPGVYGPKQVADQLLARLKAEGLDPGQYAEDLRWAANQGRAELFVHLVNMDTELRDIVKELRGEVRHEMRGRKPKATLHAYEAALKHVRSAIHQADHTLRKRGNPGGKKRPSKLRLSALDPWRKPGGYFDVEPDEMDLNIGRLVKFKNWATEPKVSGESQLHQIVTVQKIHDGTKAYRVVSLDYDDIFGRPMRPEETLFWPGSPTAAQARRLRRLRQGNPKRKGTRAGSPRRNPARHMDVASEIRRQIGGRALFMMGAKDLAGSNDGLGALRFKVGRGASRGITHIQVQLDPSDTYTVKFLKYKRGGTTETVDEYNDVYVEDLRRIISSTTGFALSM